MNIQRRKRLREALSMLAEICAIVEEVRDDEQAAFDNLPENLQGSERGQAMDEAVMDLDAIHTELQSQESALEEVVDA